MRIGVLGLVIALSIVSFGCWGDSSSSESGPQPDQQAGTAEETPIPQFTDANLALAEGIKLLENGETDKAIDVLNQAVTLDPNLAEGYFHLGIAYALVEARDESKEIVEASPTPTPSSKNRRTSVIKTNSEKAFEKAVEVYKKMIAANDQDHVAYFNLGRSYNKLNEDEEAAKALREAVKLNPEDTEYQTELGAILVKLAKYHEAITPLKKALELDPANSKAEELLADAEAGRKRIDYATKLREEKKAEKPGTQQNTNTEEKPDADPTPANAAPIKPKPSPTRPNS